VNIHPSDLVWSGPTLPHPLSLSLSFTYPLSPSLLCDEGLEVRADQSLGCESIGYLPLREEGREKGREREREREKGREGEEWRGRKKFERVRRGGEEDIEKMEGCEKMEVVKGEVRREEK
jgi:hypothetical protein